MIKKTTVAINRERIQRQIREYLERGGTISQVDHTANATWGDPPKRKRKDQVKWCKAFNR